MKSSMRLNLPRLKTLNREELIRVGPGLFLIALLFIAIPVSGYVEAFQGLGLMEGTVTVARTYNPVVYILLIRESVAVLLYIYAVSLLLNKAFQNNESLTLRNLGAIRISILVFVLTILVYAIIGLANSKWIEVLSGLRWYFYIPLVPAIITIGLHIGVDSQKRLMVASFIVVILIEFAIASVQTFVMPIWFGMNQFDRSVAIGTFNNPNVLGSLFTLSLAAVFFIFKLPIRVRYTLATISVIGIVLSGHLTGLVVGLSLLVLFAGVQWTRHEKALSRLSVVPLIALLLFAGVRSARQDSDLIVNHSLYPRVSILLNWVIADTQDPDDPPPVLVDPSPTPIATTVLPTPVSTPVNDPLDDGNQWFASAGKSAIFGKGIGEGTNTLFNFTDRFNEENEETIVDSAISGVIAQFGIYGGIVFFTVSLILFSSVGYSGVVLWLVMWMLGGTMIVFEAYPINILIIVLLVYVYFQQKELKSSTETPLGLPENM